MSLPLPSAAKDLGPWAKELIEECFVSREERRDQIKLWKSYYFTGSENGVQVPYNRCYPHIDRLKGFLFSPSDVRFSMEFDETEPQEVHAMGRAAVRKLNREFHRCNIDLSFGEGVEWALVKGCMVCKQVWGHDGIEPWLVHPEFFGVLREDISDLNRQEAFVFSTYLTKTQFQRSVMGRSDYNEIMGKVEQSSRTYREEDSFLDSYFHQIVVGGTQPVSTTTSSGKGMVGVVGVPAPMVDPKVAREMVRLDELWVMDRDRDDYTTIQVLAPDVLIEGKYKRRNLSGPADMLANGGPSEFHGIHPFTKICPNEMDGYFWGTSEISQIYKLQDQLTDALEDIRRVTRLKADEPRALIGFSGITPEKYKSLKRPGGFIAEENPNAKIEKLGPEIPQEYFLRVEKILQYFDDVAGFMPILRGEGEPGVRAGMHAQTLARNASPRMRDRAFLIERQVSDAGDFALTMLKAKKATIFDTETGEKFMLSQLPEEAKMTVDSHTSSPAFTEDNRQLAFMLAKSQAIDGEELIRLTHPPGEDNLIMRAKQKAAAEAKLFKEHPELLLAQMKARGRR